MAIFAIEISSAIPLFSRSESFNDLDPLRTTDPPLTWQPAQTFLKIVSPSLTSDARRYLCCEEIWKIIIKAIRGIADIDSIAKIANDGIGFMKGYKNKLKEGEDKVLAQWIIQNAEKGWE